MKKYHCPKCKNDGFEEVSADVTTSFPVYNSSKGLVYGHHCSGDGGYVDYCQCKSCGHLIRYPNGIPADTLEDLEAALEEQGAYTEVESISDPTLLEVRGQKMVKASIADDAIDVEVNEKINVCISRIGDGFCIKVTDTQNKKALSETTYWNSDIMSK